MKRKKEFNGITVFLSALGMAAACFLPFLIRDGGFFVYFGDYNAQQLPFYMKVHDAVRNGSFFWDMGTDLGSSIYTSYSFYLLGSPFFWLTVLFPKGAIPYLLPVFMIVKTAIASLGGYLYCRTLVKDPMNACIGGLLYGFSGFAVVSLVFHHFGEVIAFFPFYLLAAKGLGDERKYGRFACMTALMAVMNYFFFIGEAVFFILYFLVRFTIDKKMARKEKWLCAMRLSIEGLIGIFISAFFLYPSLLSVAGNQRATQSVFEKSPFFYTEVKTYLALIKGLVLPPDLISNATLFGTEEGAVASVSLFLPLFAFSGVVAYFIQKKGWDLHKKMCLLCLVLACIPLGNSLFTLGNATYYARWFFMPLLLMAAMTASALENFDRSAFSRGTILWGCMVGLFLLIHWITKSPNVEASELFTIENRSDLELEIAIGIGCLLILVYLVFIMDHKRKRNNTAVFLRCTALCCVGTMLLHIYTGYTKVSDYGRYSFRIQSLATVSATVPKEDNFFRIESDTSDANYGLFHNLPSISGFVSTVSSSIMDFYSFAGLERKVSSQIPYNRPGIRCLLSARYFLQNEQCAEDYAFVSDKLLTGYKKTGEENGFGIYENENYLHMGAVFTDYMKRSQYETLSEEEKDLVLVYALIAEDETAARLSTQPGMHELTVDDFREKDAGTEENFSGQCETINTCSAEKFTYSDTKLEFSYEQGKDGLAFLSVPYSDGFSAYSDGKEGEILLIDGGLMAIPLSAGSHTITLCYHEPGLSEGIVVSVIGLSSLVVWILIHRRRKF